MLQAKNRQSHMNKTHITRQHITQSAVAGLYILLVFWAMHFFYRELAAASLGASAFIAFRSPFARSSRPQVLIGGYSAGVLSGLLCYGLEVLTRNLLPFPEHIPACALAVFISMLLMSALSFEHPPAAAFAVAVTIDHHPLFMGAAGLACVLLLCLSKEALKKRLHMRDL